MGLISEIAEQARKVVSIGHLEFQIRRVRSSDLARAGNAQLLAMLSAKDLGSIPDMSQGDAAQLLMDRYRSMSDPQLHRMSQSHEAIACAGVVAVRSSGSDEWSPIAISVTEATDESSGVLNIQDLPEPWRKELSEQIMSHSVDDGGLQNAIDNFRAGSASHD